ncbi:MAG TPA: hypothetical protein VNI57_01495 [Candidatus Saccharimonadales bacterium]|nr:hypothetical protein [Candidatus Saccharimonadales bacterium]
MKGTVSLEARGGAATASAVDQVSGSVQRMGQQGADAAGKLSTHAEVGSRNIRLLSHEVAALAGTTGPAASGLSNIAHYLIEASNPLVLLTAAVVGGVAAWVSYREEQKRVAQQTEQALQQNQKMIETMRVAEIAGVQFTGALKDYRDAVVTLSQVEREQRIAQLIQQRDELKKSLPYVNEMGVATMKESFAVMFFGKSVKDAMRDEHLSRAEKEAQLKIINANIESLRKYGKEAPEYTDTQKRSVEALTGAYEDLYAQQIQFLALDPSKKRLASDLKIEQDELLMYRKLTEAGVSAADAMQIAQETAAVKSKQAWMDNMKEVQGLLEGGFTDAFLALGKGLDGLNKAWAKFRDDVMHYIAQMIARQTAFNIVAGAGNVASGGLLNGIMAVASPAAPTAAGLMIGAQHGAVIPGPMGSERLVVGRFHAGERIVSNTGRGSPVSGGGGGDIHNHWHTGILTSDAVRSVMRSTRRQILSLGDRKFSR